MNFIPIDCGTVNFTKCELLEDRLLMGIDCGSSLTKVIFLHKDNQSQLWDNKIDFVTFTHGLFKNDDFKDAILWTKEKAYLPMDTSCSIHITGNNVFNKKDLIESIFGLKVEYIDEMLTIIAGHRIALEKVGLESLKASSVEVEPLEKIDSIFLNNITKAINSKLSKDHTDSSAIFPCLINVYGSLTKIYYFDEEGRGEMFGYPLTGMSSFLGLAKCLLDINDYEEIIGLASIGNPANVDSQVKEIMLDDSNSPYGKLPPEMPLFAFGKSMDFNTGLENYKKEDISASLVSFFARFMRTFGLHACRTKNINKIFLTGNVFRSNLFQKSIKRSMMVFPFGIDLQILDKGYFGAIGAMFCINEDKIKYCKD